MIVCPYCGDSHGGNVKDTLTGMKDTVVFRFWCAKCQSMWFDEYPDNSRVRYKADPTRSGS